jgi:hypothetical protein
MDRLNPISLNDVPKIRSMSSQVIPLWTNEAGAIRGLDA